ncbi:BrnT family toxin [Microcoleus sp. K5-D4]
MKFEWDENKAAVNLSKHGISFEEARMVFEDPLYIDF